eukprot:gene2155-38942_t
MPAHCSAVTGSDDPQQPPPAPQLTNSGVPPNAPPALQA